MASSSSSDIVGIALLIIMFWGSPDIADAIICALADYCGPIAENE